MVILTRGIDLSIGSNVSLCCVVCTVVYRDSQSAVLSIAATFAIGFLVGRSTGSSWSKAICRTRSLPPSRHLAWPRVPRSTSPTVPRWWARRASSISWVGVASTAIPGAGAVGWFPYAALVVMAFAVLCWILLNKLVCGRWIYAVGGSPDAAVRTGVPINGVLISVYVLSGLSGAVGAFLFVGSADAGSPFTGQGMELNAIAAVIIGGGSFLGGRGTIRTP